MKDETIIKCVAIVSAAAVGIAYFVVVQKDGLILASIMTMISGIVGHSLRKTD